MDKNQELFFYHIKGYMSENLQYAKPTTFLY